MRHIEGVLIAIVYLIFISYAYSWIRFSFPKYDIIEVNRAIAYYIVQHKYFEIRDFVQYVKLNPNIVLVKVDGKTIYSIQSIQSYTTINFVFLNNSRWVEVIVGVRS